MSGLANFLGGASPVQEGGRRRRRRGSKTQKSHTREEPAVVNLADVVANLASIKFSSF